MILRSPAVLSGIVLALAALLPCAGGESGAATRTEKLRRIQQLILSGDLRQARKELRQALNSSPKDAALHNFQGVVEAQEGHYQGAESSFRKAIAIAPEFTGAYLNLGRLYQENLAKDTGALKKGIETYYQLLRYEPDNTEANYQCAFLLMLQASFQGSLDRLNRLPPKAQERPQALALRCVVHAGLNQRSEADAVAARLGNEGSLTEADVLPILAPLERHSRGDLAARLLERLADRGLASPDTLHQLGNLYERQGQLTKARDTLEKVAQRTSVSAGLLLELAHIAYKQRDFDGTLGYLAHARDLEPRNASIHFFFGLVCVELNLANEAYKSLKEAVTLDPSKPYHHYAFAGVVLYREDPSEAVPHFKKYCEMKPADPRGRFALGVAHFFTRDYESARRELEGVVKYPETAAGGHYYLGRIANQEGRLADALRELHEALKDNPQNADAYAELGLLHMKQKEYPQAEQMLRRSLELDNDNYLANLNLMVLYQRTKDPRAATQACRFDEVRKKRAEKAKELLRSIEVRP